MKRGRNATRRGGGKSVAKRVRNAVGRVTKGVRNTVNTIGKGVRNSISKVFNKKKRRTRSKRALEQNPNRPPGAVGGQENVPPPMNVSPANAPPAPLPPMEPSPESGAQA